MLLPLLSSIYSLQHQIVDLMAEKHGLICVLHPLFCIEQSDEEHPTLKNLSLV